MYIIKKTGYVIDTANESTTANSYNRYRVAKVGRVLTLNEEIRFGKNADLTLLRQGDVYYYQIIPEGDSRTCAVCSAQDGAIYPISQARVGVNFPPFHPNCRCTVEEFSDTNLNEDPWQVEALLWLDIMYGDDSLEKQAQKLIAHYGWDEYSLKFIECVLSSISNIEHIAKRMEEFFNRLPSKSLFMEKWNGQYIGSGGYEGIVVTDEFKESVWTIAMKNGMNPDDLMTLMAVESKIATQRSPYSGAVGLIQFANSNNFGYSLAEIAQMDELQQLDLVDKYFQTLLASHPAANPQNIIDLYTLMFIPASGGYGQDDSFVIAERDGRYDSAYRSNSGLDKNGDGTITRGDLRRHIEDTQSDYMNHLR